MGKHNALIFAATVLANATAQTPLDWPILFVDSLHVAALSPTVSRTLHRPSKLGRALTPTEPWESRGIFAYHSALEVPAAVAGGPRDLRLYYDCGSESAAGGGKAGLLRFMCLATSQDGVNWEKPRLGVATFNGSTANNIVWPLTDDPYVYTEPNTVVLNDAPGRSADEAFIMVSAMSSPSQGGTYTMASADGIRFRQMYGAPSLVGSDTKSVLWFDTALGRWVGYMRLDITAPAVHAPCAGAQGLSLDVRRVGRCVFSKLSSWNCTNNETSNMVVTFDAVDPPCTDVYTNGATRYPTAVGRAGGNTTEAAAPPPAVILALAAFYTHLDFGDTGYANDGWVDTRFLFARTPADNFSYVDAPRARAPWLPRGTQRCLPSGLVSAAGDPVVPPRVACATGAGDTPGENDFDAGGLFAASGYFEVNDTLLFYYGGMSFTHGGLDGALPAGAPTGVGMAALRVDGFVSLDGVYDYSGANPAPTATLGPFVVPPAEACAGGGALLLVANVCTGSAGYARFALSSGPSGAPPLPGYAATDANALGGDWVRGPLAWRGGNTSLAPLHDATVYVVAELIGAELFSLRFTCE